MLIACPGLDHVGRGFETLARECFETLRAEGSLDVRLAKGSGPRRDGELVARTVQRDGGPARVAGRALRRSPYDAEQLGFVASMLPALARFRPDVVCVSDWLASRALARVRGLRPFSFKLVVSNGGPWPAELLGHADHVQELTPAGLEHQLALGSPAERHTLLPLGVGMPSELTPLPGARRADLRAKLGLPADRRVVLSVGALSLADKRTDYLIEELAALPEPRPFLVLLGAEGADGPAIRSLAGTRLGADGHLIRTVPSGQVPDWYRAADVFALTSFVESFGRVMVEAMSHGLPCLVHDGPVQRYLLGPQGSFGDLARSGELTRMLAELDERALTGEAARERHAYVHERFSWEVLGPRYASLLRDCASRRVSTRQN